MKEIRAYLESKNAGIIGEYPLDNNWMEFEDTGIRLKDLIQSNPDLGNIIVYDSDAIKFQTQDLE